MANFSRSKWCACTLAFAGAVAIAAARQGETPVGPVEPSASESDPARPVSVSPQAAPPDDEAWPKPAPDPKPGDRVMLVFNDGTRVEGDFVRSEPRFAIVTVSNVESPFDRRTLAQIIVLETPKSRFRALRAAVKDSDAERRLDLAVWARDQQLYEEGLAEVEGVLKLDPSNADAQELRTELVMLRRLREGRAGSRAPAEHAPGDVREAPRRPRVDEFPLLSDHQVNLMKVYEVDLKKPPRITIPRETVDRLLSRYADHPLIPSTREAREAFRLLPPERILETMFRVRARDLYGEVQVLDNPASMKKFRDQVHAAWLINNCATTQCHGGTAAGRLLLTNRRPHADRSVYTNFLILDRFRTSDERPLINWSEPERSVLLQMGLPQDDAIVPHPEVRGWTPVFRTREDRRFRNAVEWMSMMYRPRPEYPIAYPPEAEGERAAEPNGTPAVPR